MEDTELLKYLFLRWSGVPCEECLALGANGSSRRYYRLVNTLSGAPVTAIGCVNDDLRENEAFFAYSRHLHAKGLPVPELYLVSDDRRLYLQQDLGDQTLYGILLDKKRQGGGFDTEMLALYRQALADLAAIQQGGADMDFSKAYPRSSFDRQSILWDLNYFKYHFLKLSHTPFDEQLLEDDFCTLTDILLQADCHFFLYRDFNPRNIMVLKNEEPADANPSLFYIDYQGGRRGAAQYDVAALLYSAKSDLPEALRRDLLNHYLDVRELKGEERSQWMSHFWAYVLIRILQSLGAYGYRGLFERKDYFFQSIPLAISNLQRLVDDHPDLFDHLPHLKHLSTILSARHDNGEDPSRLSPSNANSSILTVTVNSFSYKKGLPPDTTGNGGGFVFDCRALPNPGRYPEYKTYTGKDRPVIDFLQKEAAVDRFLDHAKALVGQSVEKYLERRFSSLQVSFGCTGGQHRSVYCAEKMGRWLVEKYPCQVFLHHTVQEKQGILLKNKSL